MIIYLFTLFVALVTADESCFHIDEVNAGAVLPWQVETVDGESVTRKPDLKIGKEITDLDILQSSPAYNEG